MRLVLVMIMVVVVVVVVVLAFSTMVRPRALKASTYYYPLIASQGPTTKPTYLGGEGGIFTS